MLPRILLLLVIVVAVFAPMLWTKSILARYRKQRGRSGLTGAELARVMLNDAGLPDVTIEETASGRDHYDPAARAVRLSPEHLNERSLSALVVAAHEVGHAIQHRDEFAPLVSRQKLARVAVVTQKVGAALIWALPIVGFATRNPRMGLLSFVGGVLTLGVGVLMHLVTLPVEYDASFNRALPILERDGHVDASEHLAARTILKACALTYVAAALADLLNVYRWLTFFRR